MSSQRASVNPLALFLKPLSPAERLTAQQRDHVKLQRKRQFRELPEGQALLRSALVLMSALRLCARETEWGARAATRASLLLSEPLLALLLEHPSRVSIAGKWVREGCFSDLGKRTCKLTAVILPMQPMCRLPNSSSTTQAAAASSGGLSNSQINFR
jgi:hypothetical protein